MEISNPGLNELRVNLHDLEARLQNKPKIKKSDEKEIITIIKKTAEILDKTTDPIDLRNSQIQAEIIFSKCNNVVSTFNKAVVIQKTFDHLTVEIKTKVELPKIQGAGATALNRFIGKLFPKFLSNLVDHGFQAIWPVYGGRMKLLVQPTKLKQLESKIQDLEKNKHQLIQNSPPLEANQVQTGETLAKTPELAKIEDQLKNLKVSLESITERKKGEIEKAQKAEETRALFTSLCGDTVIIPTSDGIKLDGCFLNIKKFWKKLHAGGGELFTMTCRFPDNIVLQLHGISFPKIAVDTAKDHVVNLVRKMGGLNEGESDTDGAGWCLIHDKDHYVIVPDGTLQKALNSTPALVQTSRADPSFRMVDWTDWQTANSEGYVVDRSYEPIDIDRKLKGGTAILSTGNGSVYEMHKREVAGFLFKGLNVMVYNFRGHGLSEGKPTPKGVQRDAEAVYQYVKQKTNEDDSRFVLLPLCMSGGAAAPVAGNHPRINIFLNQTYSDFGNLMGDKLVQLVSDKYDKLLVNDPYKNQKKTVALDWVIRNLSPLVRSFASIIAPDLNVARYLAMNKGKKAILYVHDDATIPQIHVEENIQAIAKAGQMQNLTVFPGIGPHATPWLNIKSSPFHYSNAASRLKEGKHVVDYEWKKELKEAADVRIGKMAEIATKREQAEALDKTGDSVAANELRAIADADETAMRALYNQSIAAADSKREQAQQAIKDSDDPSLPESMNQTSLTGRAQVDHFLYQANLSDDLIATDFQAKRVRNPRMIELMSQLSTFRARSQKNKAILEKFTDLDDRTIASIKGSLDGTVDIVCGSFVKKVTSEDIDALFEASGTGPDNASLCEELVNQLGEKPELTDFKQSSSAINDLSDKILTAYEQGNAIRLEKWSNAIQEQANKNDKLLEQRQLLLDDIKDLIESAKQRGEGKPTVVKEYLQEIEQITSKLETQRLDLITLKHNIHRTVNLETRGFPKDKLLILDSSISQETSRLHSEDFRTKLEVDEAKLQYDQLQASRWIGLKKLTTFWPFK